MSAVYRVIAGFGRNEYWQIQTIEEINDHWQEGPGNPLEPQAGDYVFFSNTSGIDRSHSGMVKRTEGTSLLTIEGNVSDLVKALTRRNWRTYQDGNTIVRGIGYRRIVSNTSFKPRFFYGRLDTNRTVDFSSYPVLGPVSRIAASPWPDTPAQSYLNPHSPNPATFYTDISYTLPRPGRARVVLYDLSGKVVRVWQHTYQVPGRYTVRWDGTEPNGRKVNRGIYWYKLEVDGVFAGSRGLVW
jgi:hypothetical protein